MSIFDKMVKETLGSDYFEFQSLVSSFARSIESVLNHKKMSQKDLADLLSVSEAYISKIMKGDKNVTLFTIVKIAKALKCNVQDITLCDDNFIYSYIDEAIIKDNTIKQLNKVKIDLKEKDKENWYLLLKGKKKPSDNMSSILYSYDTTVDVLDFNYTTCISN